MGLLPNDWSEQRYKPTDGVPENLGAGRLCGGRLQHVLIEELMQVAVLHVLHDHAERLPLGTHAQHAHDVHVAQLRHDLYLFQEILPADA